MKQVDADFIEAENGEKALEVLKSKTPHLIVLDIVMPVMNGFELLEQIRNNPTTKSIPVIVIASDSKMETRDKAFQMGAKDFVQKPFVTSDMFPRVKRFLG